MFEQRIFETDFKTALSEELDRRGMTVRQLSEATGIPPVTLYKISSGERDPRLSTVKKIVNVSAFVHRQKNRQRVLSASRKIHRSHRSKVSA